MQAPEGPPEGRGPRGWGSGVGGSQTSGELEQDREGSPAFALGGICRVRERGLHSWAPPQNAQAAGSGARIP